MLKHNQIYEVVVPARPAEEIPKPRWFSRWLPQGNLNNRLAAGEAVAVVNMEKLVLLMDERRRAEQLGLNCAWLISKIDTIHAAVCPGQHGTWQQRAEQVVAFAKEYPEKCSATIAELRAIQETAKELGDAAALAIRQRNEDRAKSPATHKLHCSNCGKAVSSPVPVDTVVQAWIECPACIEKADPTKVTTKEHTTCQKASKTD